MYIICIEFTINEEQAYAANDGVVGGGHRMEDAVDALQFALVLRVDAVENAVEVLERAARHQVLRRRHLICMRASMWLSC